MRISTGQIWDTALGNLMNAQIRQNTANQQVSTQKVASDLGGYGRSSEIIATYQSSLKRVDGYIGVAKTVSDRLDSQNVALERAGEGIASARETILSAIANNSVDALMSTLQSDYMAFADGINFKHQGQYLFGGGQETSAPLQANSLNDLTTIPAADTFVNGNVKKTSKIDGTTSLQTGMLASDLGTEAADLFREIKAYADANGPLQGSMTEAAQTFFQDIANRLSTAYTNMVDSVGLNGTFQNRVENSLTSLEAQAISLEGLISDKVDVNMAEAYTRLEQADIAVQASAQVVANLRTTSLLDLLR